MRPDRWQSLVDSGPHHSCAGLRVMPEVRRNPVRTGGNATNAGVALGGMSRESHAVACAESGIQPDVAGVPLITTAPFPPLFRPDAAQLRQSPRQGVQQQCRSDDDGAHAEDQYGGRAAILGHPDLWMLFGMKAIGELFERRVEEFCREYGHGRKRHERPPDGRRPQPDQRRNGGGGGERVGAEATLSAQCVRNAGEGKA
jgi:hypothetical protein